MIGTDTLLRWYVLHVLFLPFVTVIFMAIHFWRVRKDGGISGPLVIGAPGADMTEIPEHLRKRAEEARARPPSRLPRPRPAAEPLRPTQRSRRADRRGEQDPRAPARAVEVGQAKKAGAGADHGRGAGRRRRGDGGGRAAPPPLTSGPGGHTQRLLTVVKSGSIQDIKTTPVDKVHTWPHLFVVEFVAALASSAFTLIFSIFVNAPLLELANVNQTPNPSKAPWYFLGLQELLTMFHPMVAGVTIPGIGIFILIMAPYIDKNPSNKPEDRKFAVSLFTMFMMFWAVLVIIGSFFRGPGFNFVFPWTDGLFFEL